MNNNSVSKKPKMDELGEFDKVFPELLECLNEGCSKEKEMQKVLAWFKEVIDIHDSIGIFWWHISSLY